MSATASPAQTAPRPQPMSARAAIDASCRLPLLAILIHGAFWLALATLASLIASLKFHNPHFLAAQSWLTYGRVHAAAETAFLYGFGMSSALAIGLWLLCRLGRATLFGGWPIAIGAGFWNCTVFVGVIEILCGGQTGYDSFQMPGNLSVALFASYCLIALCAFLTFYFRMEQNLHPAQWFVIGSLFWFPWIFSTAAMLLIFAPLRGVVEAVVAWWCANNLQNVFLGFAGLAPIFYFIPKLLGRPLYSSYLAGLAFWTLALFGSWGSIPAGAPVPRWIISLGVVGAVLTTVSILAVAANFYHTVRRDVHALDSQLALRFTYVALAFWVIAEAQRILGVFPRVSVLTDYTWFSTAQRQLFDYGFFAFAAFGAIYYIVPRLINAEEPPSWISGLASGHFWLMLVGVLISYISLLVAGIGEGYLLNNVGYTFAQVMQGYLVPLRVETLGELLIVIGAGLFLLNFCILLSRYCCPFRAAWKLIKEGA